MSEYKAGDKVWVLCEVVKVYRDRADVYVDIRHDGAVFEAKRSDCRPVKPPAKQPTPGQKIAERTLKGIWAANDSVNGTPVIKESITTESNPSEIPNSSSEPMRDAFEQLLLRLKPIERADLARNETGYFHSEIEMAWQAFQAGVKYGDPFGGWEPTKDEIEYAMDRCGVPIADPINPSHYKQGGIECIEAIKAALGGGFPDYLRGNVMKYLWRYKEKGGVDDLKKSAWYLDRLFKEVGE